MTIFEFIIIVVLRKEAKNKRRKVITVYDGLR